MRQLVRILKRAKMSQMRKYRDTLTRLKGIYINVGVLSLEKESPDESEIDSVQKIITGLEVVICERDDELGN